MSVEQIKHSPEKPMVVEEEPKPAEPVDSAKSDSAPVVAAAN